MKIGFFLLVLGFTSVHATSFSQQKVNLDVKNETLLHVLDILQEQSGYTFLFSSEDVKDVKGISLQVQGEGLFDVLKKCLVGTGLVFEINEHLVVLRREDVKNSMQQRKYIRIVGKVTDLRKQPMPGVTIMVKGLTVGTATDMNGKYTLSLPEMKNLILVYSFVGMESQEVKYTGQDTINIVLKEAVSEMDEVTVVSTGYSNVNRRDMVGAYTTVKVDDIMMAAYPTIDQMLQGQVPGMIVRSTSARAGTSPKIQIRGTSTLLGNQDPIWVVDGIIQDDPISMNASTDMTQDMKDILGNQISWLNPKGLPQVAVADVEIDYRSENLIESKSFKLYLNSFNQSKFTDFASVERTMREDLSACAQGEVKVRLHPLSRYHGQSIDTLTGDCIDDQDIEIHSYEFNADILQNCTSDNVVEETLVSHLLKSNCLITSQPDWGTVQIHYVGKQIDREKLLRYIVSFRQHNEFHEQCVERIFCDLMHYAKPEKLTVYARYTRRGGLDINPFRSNFEDIPQNLRLARQ